MNQQYYKPDISFQTENGDCLTQPVIAYKTWGNLNASRDNVILICHALTGHADAEDWFPGPFQEGGFINPEKHFVICANVPGSCYGSSGPESPNPETGRPYSGDFPKFSIRDIVRFHQLLLDHLQIEQVQVAIGASMGGMQALEWLIMDERIQRGILIAVNKAHTAWCIGISEAQRNAIYADGKWNGGFPDPKDPPASGLATARMMAMITYRSAVSFERRFGRYPQQDKNLFQVESYLRYQGEKLVNRMNAVTYVRLTQSMDSHDVSRDRADFSTVLRKVRQPVLVVGISSDILYPTADQKELADLLGNARYQELESDNGHDAFLIEFEKMNVMFNEFLASTSFIF